MQRTPEEWLKTLSANLDARAQQIDVYRAYYDGEHPLAFASSKFRQNFGRLFDQFADNWCELVVDAVEERLNVEGFRVGEVQQGDAAAWDIWQANQLDADSQLAHIEALINGEASAIIWPNDDNPCGVDITVESASQVMVATDPATRKRAAALKKWRDDSGYIFATLYLPDGLYKFQSTRKIPDLSVPVDIAPPGSTNQLWTPMQSSTVAGWERREVPDEAWPLHNPLGQVPVIPLVNRPRLLKPGVSEIAQVIPVQNAVNKLVADMLVASEFAAYRQRWATGLELPIDPDTKQPVEPFKHAIDRMWVANPRRDSKGNVIGGDTKFGEFSVTELQNYVTAIEMCVQHIASQTRTPPHYFYLKGQMPSGESIKSAETGLVAKAKRKSRFFGEAWEEVIRIAFLCLDDPKGKEQNTETLWSDPEYRTEGEHIDACVKLLALEVPLEALWERAGFSQEQIARFKALRAEETPAEQIVETPSAVTETLNIRA